MGWGLNGRAGRNLSPLLLPSVLFHLLSYLFPSLSCDRPPSAWNALPGSFPHAHLHMIPQPNGPSLLLCQQPLTPSALGYGVHSSLSCWPLVINESFPLLFCSARTSILAGGAQVSSCQIPEQLSNEGHSTTGWAGGGGVCNAVLVRRIGGHSKGPSWGSRLR